MPINRNLWQQPLKKSYTPAWPCPACAEGRLRLKGNTLHFEETAESQCRRRYDDFHIAGIVFAFSALLECTRCDEKVSCCGDGSYVPENYTDEEGNYYTDYDQIFFPVYFSRPMILFNIPNNCPDSIVEQLHRSFAVFFCDLGAAASHLRPCVEEILTLSGVLPTNAPDKFVPLERRIQLIEERDLVGVECADTLKWICNLANHPKTLNKDDIFDVYDILEVLLAHLYVDHHWHFSQRVAQAITPQKAKGN